MAAITGGGAGCGPDRYKTPPVQPVYVKDLKVAPERYPTGDELVFGSGGPPNLEHSLGVQTIVGATGTYGQNLQPKADVYTAIVHVFEAFGDGNVGHDARETLDNVEKKVGTAGADENVAAMRAAIATLRKAMDAEDMEQLLAANHLYADQLPWSAGAWDMQQQLKKLRAGRKKTHPAESARLPIEAIAHFAAKYHMAPTLVRADAIHTANDEVEDLYDRINAERKAAKTFTVERGGFGLKPNPSNDPYADGGWDKRLGNE